MVSDDTDANDGSKIADTSGDCGVWVMIGAGIMEWPPTNMQLNREMPLDQCVNEVIMMVDDC